MKLSLMGGDSALFIKYIAENPSIYLRLIFRDLPYLYHLPSVKCDHALYGNNIKVI